MYFKKNLFSFWTVPLHFVRRLIKRTCYVTLRDVSDRPECVRVRMQTWPPHDVRQHRSSAEHCESSRQCVEHSSPGWCSVSARPHGRPLPVSANNNRPQTTPPVIPPGSYLSTRHLRVATQGHYAQTWCHKYSTWPLRPSRPRLHLLHTAC